MRIYFLALGLIDSGGRRCMCGMSYQQLQMEIKFFLKKHKHCYSDKNWLYLFKS